MKSLIANNDKSGLGIFTAAFFIVGTCAGVGIFSLPQAITFCQSSGFILLLVFCGLSCYTGVVLANCWLIVSKHYQDCAPGTIIRKPYPIIAEKCFGKPGRYFIAIYIDIILFGVSVVFTVLAGTLISGILTSFLKWNISFCFLMPIFAIISTPLTWFGSPKDFAHVAFIASMGTLIACFIIFVDNLRAIPKIDSSERGKIDPIVPSHFFMALGTIAFSFSSHSVLLTVQNDMKNPKRFFISAIISYSSIQFCWLTYLFDDNFG